MLKFAGLQGPVMFDVAPSSSGLGYRVFIPKIAGSNPAGATKLVFSPSAALIISKGKANSGVRKPEY